MIWPFLLLSPLSPLLHACVLHLSSLTLLTVFPFVFQNTQHAPPNWKKFIAAAARLSVRRRFRVPTPPPLPDASAAGAALHYGGTWGGNTGWGQPLAWDDAPDRGDAGVGWPTEPWPLDSDDHVNGPELESVVFTAGILPVSSWSELGSRHEISPEEIRAAWSAYFTHWQNQPAAPKHKPRQDGPC
ncbi:hypothetical protein K438DRAFT_1991767 [Mycena galopus ATCC 62051]|nr:hypothetical protein K438DRAFT_1991767 [Mycena galopus ATCC 62051]